MANHGNHHHHYQQQRHHHMPAAFAPAPSYISHLSSLSNLLPVDFNFNAIAAAFVPTLAPSPHTEAGSNAPSGGVVVPPSIRTNPGTHPYVHAGVGVTVTPPAESPIASQLPCGSSSVAAAGSVAVAAAAATGRIAWKMARVAWKMAGKASAAVQMGGPGVTSGTSSDSFEESSLHNAATGREKLQPAGGGDDATNTPTGRERLQPAGGGVVWKGSMLEECDGEEEKEVLCDQSNSQSMLAGKAALCPAATPTPIADGDDADATLKRRASLRETVQSSTRDAMSRWIAERIAAEDNDAAQTVDKACVPPSLPTAVLTLESAVASAVANAAQERPSVLARQWAADQAARPPKKRLQKAMQQALEASNRRSVEMTAGGGRVWLTAESLKHVTYGGPAQWQAAEQEAEEAEHRDAWTRVGESLETVSANDTELAGEEISPRVVKASDGEARQEEMGQWKKKRQRTRRNTHGGVSWGSYPNPDMPDSPEQSSEEDFELENRSDGSQTEMPDIYMRKSMLRTHHKGARCVRVEKKDKHSHENMMKRKGVMLEWLKEGENESQMPVRGMPVRGMPVRGERMEQA